MPKSPKPKPAEGGSSSRSRLPPPRISRQNILTCALAFWNSGQHPTAYGRALWCCVVFHFVTVLFAATHAFFTLAKSDTPAS
jgi:hypothetical protein